MIMQVLMPGTVRVRALSVGGLGIQQGALALNPSVPLSSSLTAALPVAAMGPYVSRTQPGGVPSLHLVREDTMVELDPQKPAEDQGVKDGDTLSLVYSAESGTSATYDQILKMVTILLVKQGRSEGVLKDLSTMVEHERHFKQRDWALRFILWLFAFLVVISVALITADGFRVWNFQLDAFVRNGLTGAVLGEVATLAVVAFRFVFSAGSQSES